MDFAPYQSSPPETARSPTTSPRPSTDRTWSPFAPPHHPSPPPLQHPQPQRGWQPSSLPGSFPAADARREGVSEFDTSLGARLDWEAVAAYVFSPPLGAILLLILERNSDYVRYGWPCSPLRSVRCAPPLSPLLLRLPLRSSPCAPLLALLSLRSSSRPPLPCPPVPRLSRKNNPSCLLNVFSLLVRVWE